MQSYVIENQPANIVEEVKDWFNNMVAMHQKALDRVTHRDPDDMLPYIMVLLWILAGICIIVCTAFGTAYHYTVFKQASGSGIWGVVASGLFLIAVELTTVFIGLYFFDAIIEKIWWKSVKRFILVGMLGAIVFFAVRWSISISTKGVATVNQQIRLDEVYQKNELTALPPALIAIDSQLSKVNHTIETAKKSTWRGRPTGEGLRVVEENTSLQRDLMRQREIILKASMSQQDSLMQNEISGVRHTSNLLLQYGGYAEYAKLACLFLIALIGAILRDKYREENPEPEPEENVGK